MTTKAQIELRALQIFVKTQMAELANKKNLGQC